MRKSHILVVEDDPDIFNMLRIFFSTHGFQVDVAQRGYEAINACRIKLPDLILLDINMPEMDGYEVCKILRATTRTSHIPIIFLTQRDERSDRLGGLELGADDYITKPFDITELLLRVRRAIDTYKQHNLTDPITGLPSGRLIERQLYKMMEETNWFYFHICIDHNESFQEEYGFLAYDEVLRFTTLILHEVDDEFGTLDDFIGHATKNIFILVTKSPEIVIMVEKIRQFFKDGILSHYSFIDREQGGILRGDGRLVPIMKLSIGIVSGEAQRFSDIREIVETASELRRLDKESDGKSLISINHNPLEILEEFSTIRSETNQIKPYSKVRDCYELKEKKSFETSEIAHLLQKTKKLIQSIIDPFTDALTWLDPKITKKPPPKMLAQLHDRSNQLREFLSLADDSLEMTLAFIEIDSLTSSKIHDMKIISELLELVPEFTSPLEKSNPLITHQHLCRITFENLNDLRLKILDYQNSNPISLPSTIKQVIDLMRLTGKVSFSASEDHVVLIPKLKLEQSIYNILSAYISLGKNNRIDIFIRKEQDAVFIYFKSEIIPRTKLTKLYQNLIEKNNYYYIYLYLSKKIISRYDGSINFLDDGLEIGLPIQTRNIAINSSALKSNITNQLEDLEAIGLTLSSDSVIFNLIKSTERELSYTANFLIDPIAKDLLGKISTFLEVLESTPDIDCNVAPWSKVAHRLRFFRFLTLELLAKHPINITHFDLKSLLTDVVESIPSNRRFEQQFIILSDVENPHIRTDRLQLLRVLLNLALNALDAMPIDGILTFIIKQEEHWFSIEVVDNGKGIPSHILPQIANLFFTTKGYGRGIGLFNVLKIIKDLQGKIEVCSNYGEGTTFIVKVPKINGSTNKSVRIR
ncbi:MAG: response regulator [Bdellovibrionales bacterium]|nr:response regulator [Bdellovibrionales bacterium]